MLSTGGTSILTSLSTTAPQMDRLSCMIVDGNRHMRTLLKGVIRAFGIRNLIEAPDAPEAISEMKTTMIDVIITEFALATLDGLDLTKLIRTGSDSPNPLVPIIMLTGHTERNIVSRARDVGVNEFLAKPISAESLYVRIVSSVFNPRPFVRAKSFLGPDRRRHILPNFKGSEHRMTSPELIIPRIWQNEMTEGNAAGRQFCS